MFVFRAPERFVSSGGNLNLSNNIPKQCSNLISYIMSLSFNDFYLKNITVEDVASKYKYEYYLISKYKELGIDKEEDEYAHIDYNTKKEFLESLQKKN